MRTIIFSALLLVSAAACANNDSDSSDTSKVNGSISISDGQTATALDTVNGSIRVGANATITKAGTVNGSITLGANVTAQSLDTVNGAIDVGSRSKIAGDIDAVNGRVSLAEGVDVGGKLENVNGTIRISAAHVVGHIKTTSGDIQIGADSRVDGGILVEKPGWFFGNSKTPTITIGPRAVVGGTLEFRREVELFISDSATVGPITGATAKRFSGDSP